MFFEFVHAVLTLDLNWLAWLLFANLHYLFAFAALIFILFNGKTKSVLPGFIFFFLLCWAFTDFTDVSGWVFFVGGFLGLNYIAKIGSLTFAASDPKLEKYMLAVNFVITYSLWAAYNLFIVGGA